MPLDASEKSRIRAHLGYPQVTAAASIHLGIPAQSQLGFVLEQAMNLLMEDVLDRVRRILRVLDEIEDKMIDAQDRLAASALEELKLRDGEPDLLEKEFARWGFRLAGILGVPPYQYSPKYQGFMGQGAGNVSVKH